MSRSGDDQALRHRPVGESGAFFARATSLDDGEHLEPTARAASQWGGGDERMRGMAVSGAMARAVETSAREHGPAGARATRWSVDLFRVTALAGCAVRTALVRSSARTCLIDATVTQAGRPTARARALFLVPPGAHDGPDTAPRADTWEPSPLGEPPPIDLVPPPHEPRLYQSEGIGWTISPEPHQTSARKQIWQLPVEVVAGETATPFQAVAMAADLASVVTNWGSRGMAFINADIDLALARPPVEREVGLAALHHVQQDGLSTGSAVVFDRIGALGTASIVAIARGQVVDPRARARPR